MTGKLGVRRRLPPSAGLPREPGPLSADDVLAVVAREVPAALVARKELAAIRAVARRWPVTTEMGFECRLREGASGADFGLCIRSGRGERARLLEGLRDRFPGALEDVPYRAGLLTLLEGMCGEDPFLASHVRNLCFEIDLSRAQGVPPPPGMFVGLWHAGTEHLEGAPAAGASGDAAAVLMAVADLLLAEPLPPDALSRVEEIERSLGERGYVANLGLLPARELRAVRVNVGGADLLADSDRWLDGLAWPGDRTALAGALALVADAAGADVYVNVDAGDEILPSLGLEIFFHHQPGRSRACLRLLDRLVAEGLCAREKREALLAWPGATGAGDGTWPDALAALSALFAPYTSVVVRTLNHLKLVLSPDGALEAKAYIAFGHRWVAPGGS